MTEPNDDLLRGTDAPRALPDALRARLESALAANAGPLAGADGPRPLPPETKERVRAALTTRTPLRRLRRAQVVAIAAAILLIAGAVATAALTGSNDGRTVAAPTTTDSTTTTAASTTAQVGPPPTDPPVVPQEAVEPVEIRLRPFRTCDELLTYLTDNALALVTSYGVKGLYEVTVTASGAPARGPVGATDPQPSPGAGGTGSGGGSDQNTQEPGILEPDRVQTNRDYAYVLHGEKVTIVDLHSAPPELLSTIDVPHASQLLLAGTRLLAFSHWYEPREVTPPPNYAGETPLYNYANTTTITSIDVSDATAPSIIDAVTVDGFFNTARLIDGVARVIVGSQPAGLALVLPGSPGPEGEQAALELNRASIEASTVEQWIGDRPCSQVDHPESFAGFGMTTMYTIDPAAPSAAQAVSVLANAGTVYASAASVYLATTRFEFQYQYLPAGPIISTEIDPSNVETEVHRFDLVATGGQPRYAGTAILPGYLHGQFSMSEHNGHLRVATTSNQFTSNASSSVIVLAVEDEALTETGRVEGFGTGEEIQGVRFVGDIAFVVTFRRTDPLFAIDLRSPSEPVLRGALEITGYSAYLHPLAENLLLGVGQEADANGRTTGTQVSVLDVADLDAPALLDRFTLPNSYTPVEYDHLAFTFWPTEGIALVPVVSWDSPYGSAHPSLLVCLPNRDGVAVAGLLPDAGERSVIANGLIYAISDDHVRVFDVATLDDLGATALP